MPRLLRADKQGGPGESHGPPGRDVQKHEIQYKIVVQPEQDADRASDHQRNGAVITLSAPTLLSFSSGRCCSKTLLPLGQIPTPRSGETSCPVSHAAEVLSG